MLRLRDAFRERLGRVAEDIQWFTDQLFPSTAPKPLEPGQYQVSVQVMPVHTSNWLPQTGTTTVAEGEIVYANELVPRFLHERFTHSDGLLYLDNADVVKVVPL
jgi:hypothetical protein